MDRRELLRLVPAGTALGCAGLLAGRGLGGEKGIQEKKPAAPGLPPLKIIDVGCSRFVYKGLISLTHCH